MQYTIDTERLVLAAKVLNTTSATTGDYREVLRDIVGFAEPVKSHAERGTINTQEERKKLIEVLDAAMSDVEVHAWELEREVLADALFVAYYKRIRPEIEGVSK